MKTILFLIFISLMYFPLVADEPNDLQNPTCEECNTIPHKFPHKICDRKTGKIDDYCFEFPVPTSGWQERIMEYKCLLKRTGVLCSKFDALTFPWTINSVDPKDNSREESWNLIVRGTSTGPKIVFDIEDLDDSKPPSVNPIKRALNEWNSVCERTDNPDSEENTCCVLVYFETDELEIELKHRKSIAVSNYKIQLKESDNSIDPIMECNYQCLKKNIDPPFTLRFNATDGFTQRFPAPRPVGAPATSLPRQFFITRDLIPDGSNIEYGSYEGDEVNFYDIYTIVLHELGHLLGFGHFENDGNNPCKDVNNTTQGIMYTLVHNSRKELTWRDGCAYKRMYCCPNLQRCVGYVSVQEEENSADGKIPRLYPNPTNRTLTIPYNFESSVEYVVFAVDGTVVQTGTIPEGSDGFTFDVSSLSNGAYTLVLNSAKPVFRKFIISK